MDVPTRSKVPLAALAAVAMVWLTSCAGTPTAAPSTESISRDSGERLYKESCSACHGPDARGNGPVAPILKVPVPDLTLIASRRGGSFPEDEIYRIVDGQADLGAHGSRNMPVWGYEFFGDDTDDELAHREATLKTEKLVEFLRSVQRSR
jgi:mono/diheme cytochrome c family protein